ncbi:iron uptake system protein EfeO [Actinophytocola oryzae]|uniref:Iron uptake system component EfeO n=1 Tax=Actinophytocola oryzae TaxID=502181 RepID=A0A4R7V953_9PSEU|nr:iron uptake system protein EfeO [Actinophytocola oryzae]TDV45453.1 iron uptake system component EfeO [Actinophytocola oryzae]
MTSTRAVLVGALALVTLAGCGTATPSEKTGGAITVSAGDDSCKVARTSSDAGNITFEVTNKGNRVTEFYLYAEGDRIMGEVENITPGLTRRLIVEVSDSGKYETACKPGMQGKGIRGDFTVTGNAKKATDTDEKLADATASYQRYVNSQVVALVDNTKQFTTAVKAGDVEKAKSLYPVARLYWERIEPVAESFGDIDPKTDGREDALDPGMAFTGYHRLEKDLWSQGLQPDSNAIADQLMSDIEDLATRAKTVELTPLQLANGAKDLLDEVATGKITGEEDRYSHTDLWDFRANVDGSQAAINSLRPVIQDRDPDLLTTLDKQFAAVDAVLEKHQKGDGYKLYTELTQDDIKEMSEVVDALGEPISQVAEVVAGK